MLPLCRLCHPCHGRTDITKAINSVLMVLLSHTEYLHYCFCAGKIRVCHNLTLTSYKDVLLSIAKLFKNLVSWMLSKSLNLLTLSANNHQTTSNCWTHLLWSGQAGLEVTVCQPHWSPAGQLSHLQAPATFSRQKKGELRHGER